MSLTKIEPYMFDSTANVALGNVTVAGTSSLGNVGNVKITGGNSTLVLSTDGTGNLNWVPTIHPFLLMGG